MISIDERKRYLRQLLLSDFGDKAQEKLKESAVFIAGAGGLGGPVSFYLAAAGVGRLVICDKDHVELSNLNRQILHSSKDIDIPKADSAKETLEALNPSINIETHNIFMDDNTIHKYAEGADIIVDCLDNVKTRQMLNKYCLETGTPMMHAGIDSWTGQITLLNPPETPCINCLFESYKESGKPKPVLGAMAGIIGTTQALETIKYLTGIGESLKNKLAYFDSLNMEWTKIPISRNNECKVCSTSTKFNH